MQNGGLSGGPQQWTTGTVTGTAAADAAAAASTAPAAAMHRAGAAPHVELSGHRTDCQATRGWGSEALGGGMLFCTMLPPGWCGLAESRADGCGRLEPISYASREHE